MSLHTSIIGFSAQYAVFLLVVALQKESFLNHLQDTKYRLEKRLENITNIVTIFYKGFLISSQHD